MLQRPMTIYSIVSDQEGTGFNVEVVSDNGAHQTMMGFASETEAEAWIASDRERDRNAGHPRGG